MKGDQADPRRREGPGALHRRDAIRLGRAVCGELAQAERREWWLANGRGAYAAGTVAGTRTRGYHGLLIAPVDPPLGRRLLVVKMDATLIDGERTWPLFSNRWAERGVEPAGHVLIESFRLEGRMPVWHWVCADLIVEQRIWMPPGENGVWLTYRLLRGRAGAAPRLRIALLLADRDHHQVRREGGFDPPLGVSEGRLRMPRPDGSALTLIGLGGTLEADPAWVEHLALPIEQERGLPHSEDHLRVGFAELSLGSASRCGVLATLTPCADPDPAQALQRVRRRDRSLLRTARAARSAVAPFPGWIDQLVLAADSFVIERAIAPQDPREEAAFGTSVIAGYPWFGDWGRDTMIALPGLTLATGRPGAARRILETFTGLVDRGMLPNRFPGSGEVPEYNTVDAALWLIEAWRAYLAVADDLHALARAFPVLDSIITHYREGTRFGIAMDPADGLIRAGEPGIQLTWMDAKVGDWVVTPRIGKPVEVNALWHNGLRIMADFADRLGLDASAYRAGADAARAGFARFVRRDGLGLCDVLDGPQGADTRIRPNQIFAVSLAHSPLERADQAAVVAVCERHLLCSYGLRSLTPEDPDYRGQYGGDVRSRDAAYHQGTVWAWLLGPYALAEHRVTGDAAAAQARLEPISDHLLDAGLGTVSEIFDGDPPHRPRGCPAQAWSVACILDAWMRLEHWRFEAGDRRRCSPDEARAQSGSDPCGSRPSEGVRDAASYTTPRRCAPTSARSRWR